jgi:cyclase
MVVLKKYKPSKNIREVSEKFRRKLILEQTDAEQVFKYILTKLKIKYKFQFIIYYPYSFYILDFFLPEYKIIFEIDGSQHYDKEGIKKDKKRTKILNSYGLEVIRFKNSEVFNIQETMNKCKEFLDI